MNREQKSLWNRLLTVWNGEQVACQIYLARRYIEKFPDDMFGWIALADGLTGIASYEKSMDALKAARRRCPVGMKSVMYKQFGRFYREKGNFTRAEKWFSRAVNVKPSQEALVMLGACLAKQGKYGKARECHIRAIEFAPATADEALLNLGLICRAEEQYVEALYFLNRALEIDPEYEEAKIAKADITLLLELRSNGAARQSRRRKIEN